MSDESEREGWETARNERLIKQRLEELTGVPWEVREKSNFHDICYICRQWPRLSVFENVPKQSLVFSFATPPYDRSRQIRDEELLKFAAMAAARWERDSSEVL